MNAQFYQSTPEGLTEGQTRRQFNKDYATAVAQGDPRYQMKQLDRPGVSRGAGQMNQAGINAAQDVADGIARAYSNQLDARVANANLDLNSARQAEGFGQALQGLQSQASYANQMTALQRQNALMGLIGG